MPMLVGDVKGFAASRAEEFILAAPDAYQSPNSEFLPTSPDNFVMQFV